MTKSGVGLLGHVAQGGEGGGIVDRSLGEHLAVHVHTGHLQAVHEGGVIHAVGLAAGTDTGDPQLAEVALLLLAADVSIAAGLHQLLIGHLIVTGLVAPVTLCKTENLASVLAGHHCAFNSCHFNILLLCVSPYL